MLHGEQSIELHKDIPTHGKLQANLRVVDILDKKSGALLIFDSNSFDFLPLANCRHITRSFHDFMIIQST